MTASPFQRSLLAAAACALASSAQAQATVQIYGVIDAGVTSVSGLRNGTVKQLVSGIMDGSRVGLRANEDLGGGWRALVTLEHRLEADTGLSVNRPASGSQLPDRVARAALLGLPAALQPVVDNVGGSLGATLGVNLTNNFWDRQAFVGLVTPVGAVLAGRQYTPAYEVSASFDALGTQSALAFGQVAAIPASIDIRVSNALQYRALVGGLTVSLMQNFAEGSASAGRLLGGMAIYRGAGWSVGGGHNTRKSELGATSLTSTVLGASAAAFGGEGFVQIVQVKDDNPSGLAGLQAQLTPVVGAATAGLVQDAFVNGFRQDARAWHLGFKRGFGAHTVYVAYNRLDDRRAAKADTASYGLTYSYALSRRTDVNTSATRFDNRGLGQAAAGGGGYLGGVTATAGRDSTSLALGLRHRF